MPTDTIDEMQQDDGIETSSAPKSRKKMKWLIAGGLLLAGVGIVAFSQTKSKAETPPPAATEKAPPVLSVQPAIAEPRSMMRRLEVSGSVSAWDLLTIQPAANGLKIMQVYVDAGDRVTAGQILVQLDDASLRAQRAAALAQLSNAQAMLSKMQNPSRRQDIVSQKAAVTQAQANLTNARANYDRFASLLAQGAVSQAEADLRKMNLDTAQASYDQAQQRLSLTVEGSRSEDIQSAQAQVASAQAQIQQIEAQLQQTQILAPTSGLILTRSVRLGGVASAGTPFFTMVRDGRLELQAQVPEIDIPVLKIGASVTITSDAIPNLKATGRIRQVGPGVDQTSRQTTVKIDIVSHNDLRVGQFVRGHVDLGQSALLAIPASAVLNQGGSSQVFVIEGDIVKNRAVTMGVKDKDLVEIRDGLKAGEQVVSSGAGFLRDGDRVQLIAKTGS